MMGAISMRHNDIYDKLLYFIDTLLYILQVIIKYYGSIVIIIILYIISS
jgi:hypothetical protein